MPDPDRESLIADFGAAGPRCPRCGQDARGALGSGGGARCAECGASLTLEFVGRVRFGSVILLGWAGGIAIGESLMMLAFMKAFANFEALFTSIGQVPGLLWFWGVALFGLVVLPLTRITRFVNWFESRPRVIRVGVVVAAWVWAAIPMPWWFLFSA